MLYHPPSDIADKLRQPSIVPREHIRDNHDMHMRLAELGLGSIIDVESASNVFVATKDKYGYIIAAGVLINPPYQRPEAHVRAGEIGGFVSDSHGDTSITMTVDDLSIAAASLTWSELLKIARERNEYLIKGFSIGTPAQMPTSDFRHVGSVIGIPNAPLTQCQTPDQNLQTRIAC